MTDYYEKSISKSLKSIAKSLHRIEDSMRIEREERLRKEREEDEKEYQQMTISATNNEDLSS